MAYSLFRSALPRLQQFQYEERREKTKPNGKPILCSTQCGTAELECGFPAENIISTTPVEDCPFLCPICKGLPRYPVEIKNCGHLFCRCCIHQVLRSSGAYDVTVAIAECPICKKLFSHKDSIDISSSSRCLYNLYNSTDLRCTYGCSHTSSPSGMLEHESWECERRPVRCPNSGCKHQATDTDMEKHLDQCPNRRLYCPQCRLPKRASDKHNCVSALRATIDLLVGDRIATELFVENLFGEPNATFFGSEGDIGTQRLEREEQSLTHNHQLLEETVDGEINSLD